MEKALWMALGVLGIGLHPMARAEQVPPAPQSRPMIISVAAPLMPLPTPVPHVTKLLNLTPTVEPTGSGIPETAGAAIIGFVALWAARRRRLV